MSAAEYERICAAMTDLVIERGYENVTVADVSERAGVDAAAFHAHFADKAECFLAIYMRNTERFAAPIFAAFEAGDSWRDALRNAAYGAARFLREHPREVSFNVTVALGAGEMPQAQRDAFLQSIIDLVDRGRQELDDPDSVSRSVAEGVIGSIYQTLIREVEQGDGTKSAEDYVPELMYIAVRPYLGHRAALEELEIPPPTTTT